MNQERLAELDKLHFIHPTSSIQDQQAHGPKMIIEKGEGIYLTDKNGSVYIDAMSSLWNVNVGHGREELADAAAEQMKKLAFSSSFSTFSNEPAILLAEKISSIAPKGLNAVFFTSGGSESNDTAIKLARHFFRIQDKPEKRKIIGLGRAYHGVAAASTSATGIPEFWNMAGKMMVDMFHADNPYGNGKDKALQSLRAVIEKEGPGTIAAFMAEPIQGAGGVLIPPVEYLQEVRKICDEYGILFIADEVITGFGRTGKWFGIEHSGVTPDLISFAKGVSSGYIQLGGVLVSDHIHETLKEKSAGTLFHGYTYSGHPAAAAVGLKNIEIIENEGLVENSRRMGEVMLAGFKELKNKLDIIGDVRALGLLGAVELVEDPKTNKRFASELKVAPRVIEALHQRGVICRAVTYEQTDIICFAPPLVITEEEIETMLKRLEEAITEVRNELARV